MKYLKATTAILIVKWLLIIADVILTMMIYIALGDITKVQALDETSITEAIPEETKEIEIQVNKAEAVVYTQMDVPYIDSSWKSYMDYRTITNATSDQYKFIHNNAYSDENGFMRSKADPEIGQEYYLVALGSFYGTKIGTKYRITTDKGNVFYAVLGDCKDDRHTNSTHQYTTVGNYNVVEFLVDTKTLIHEVKYHGTANRYAPLGGKITKIERINFREC